jgi:LasA protease
VQADGPALKEQDLIYNNEQILNFSIEDYLITYVPHLSPYAEAISHWAGFSSISPKILTILMEQQSSVYQLFSYEDQLMLSASTQQGGSIGHTY